MQDSIYGYLQQLSETLTSVSGLVGLIFAILLFITLGTVPKARWAVLSLFIFIATFDVGGSQDELVRQMDFRQLPFPMGQIRDHARLLEILLGASLLIPFAKTMRGWRFRIVPSVMVLFVILNIWMCLRLMPEAASRPRGVLSLVSYFLLFLTLSLGIGRSLQTMEDAYAFIKSLVGVAVIFVVANVYYVLRNPAAAQGRFWGTTPNPQAVGQVVALLLPPVLCMIHSSRLGKAARASLWTVVGLLVIFLLWSGSRTGAAMALLGLALFYRIQLKRAVLGFLIGGVAVTLALAIFPQSLVSVQRFTDPANSRAEAWQNLIELFQSSPLFGVTFQGTGYGEGFFLATLANYGLIGAIPAFACVILLAKSVVGVYRRRHLLGEHSMLADVFVAQMGMTLVGMVFESSLLGVWNVVTLLFYLYGAYLGFLNDTCAYVASGPTVESQESAMPELASGVAY